MSIYKGTDLVAGAVVIANIEDIIDSLYPIGSVYIGTTSICPLAAIKGTWTLKSSGRVLQGADSNHAAGTTIEAGLPAHTHKIYGSGEGGTGNAGLKNYISGTSNSYTPGYFDTSRTYAGDFLSNPNSIYGNSTTVQPPAYVVNIWERTA